MRAPDRTRRHLHPPVTRAAAPRGRAATRADRRARPAPTPRRRRPAAQRRGGTNRNRPALPPAPHGRGLLIAAAACSVPALLTLALYLFPELQAGGTWLAMAAAFVPYGWLAWLAATVLALLGTRGRARLFVAPLALGLAWHCGTLAPYLPATTAGPAGDRVTLLALNLQFGEADLSGLADRVGATEADVVVLTEVTRSSVAAVSRGSWARRFPYRSGTAGEDGANDARGTMVLSRHPLTELGSAKGTTFSNLALRVRLPGRPFTLVAAHPANPPRGLDGWLGDADAVTRLAIAHGGGPLVVAGDLNATAEHLTLRRLQARAGLANTATGRGWHPTYPADAWFPPLIAIDHVLASPEFRTSTFRTVRVEGTDHLGLLVGLRLGER